MWTENIPDRHPLPGLAVETVTLVLQLRHDLGAVFVAEQFLVRSRDAHGHTFKEAIAEREDVLLPELVAVAGGEVRDAVHLCASCGSDVDVQAGFCVYPATVDLVLSVPGGCFGVMRVDLEHVRSALLGGGHGVIVYGHVVVPRQVVHCIFRYHDIDVRVPRQDTLVPPPPDQRAMNDPGIGLDSGHSLQVALDQSGEGLATWRVLEFVLREAAVVVITEAGIVRLGGSDVAQNGWRCLHCFMEVLRGLI